MSWLWYLFYFVWSSCLYLSGTKYLYSTRKIQLILQISITRIKETLSQYQSYCKIFISLLRLCQKHIYFFQFKTFWTVPFGFVNELFARIVLCMARTIVLWKKTSRKNILNNEVQNYSTFLCRLFVSNLCESYDTTAHDFSANFYWNAINHHAQDLFDFQLFSIELPV